MTDANPLMPAGGLPGMLGAPELPGKPQNQPPGESPGSFADFGDDAKNAGKEVGSTAAETAQDSAKDEGAAMANDLIADAKNGKPPQPAAVVSRAKDAGKRVAKETGNAAIDSAKQQAEAQVDKSLAIIGNEFPMLASILGLLSKPVIQAALNECEMPDF